MIDPTWQRSTPPKVGGKACDWRKEARFLERDTRRAERPDVHGIGRWIDPNDKSWQGTDVVWRIEVVNRHTIQGRPCARAFECGASLEPVPMKSASSPSMCNRRNESFQHGLRAMCTVLLFWPSQDTVCARFIAEAQRASEHPAMRLKQYL
eukprot:scaffold25_cov342-Pavlova_lutheri.AAC.16